MKDEEATLYKLSMEPFYLVFMILGAGLGIATLVFVLELLTMKLGNKASPSKDDCAEVAAGKQESRADTNNPTDVQIKHDVLTRGDEDVVLPGVVTKEDDIEVIETTLKKQVKTKRAVYQLA